MFTTYHLTGSICMVTIVLILGTLSLASASPFTLALENVPPGDLPPGWRIAATNPQGRLAEWAVVPDAGSAKVFSLTKIHDGSRGGGQPVLEPRHGILRRPTGSESPGQQRDHRPGWGLIWRARDPNNYYTRCQKFFLLPPHPNPLPPLGGEGIRGKNFCQMLYVARYNPLEANFRLYFVKDGQRQMLADKGGLNIRTGEWFTLEIVHRGDKIEGWLNGGKLLEATDRTFLGAGGIGFWTKADAATSFAGLQVQP